MPNDTSAVAGSKTTKCWSRLLPCALLALFAAQSLWFIATQSLTYDEPAHIIAGSDAWRFGRFSGWIDHPPLGRLWLTLPMAATPMEVEIFRTERNIHFTRLQPGPEWLSWHTRPMSTLLGLALGIALWFTTRRLFSEGAANVALALFAFTPSLIAHYSVATNDGIGTLFTFLVAMQLVRWRRNPSPWQTGLMGVLLGGFLISKFYSPPMVLLALALMLFSPREGRQRRLNFNWKPTLAAVAIAAFVVWAGYFFHISHLEVGNGHVRATFPNGAARDWPTTTKLHLSMYVPAGEFVEGLREVSRHNSTGRPAWFLGKIYPRGGIRAYYPVAIALKWPSILLLLTVLSITLGLRKTCRAPGDLLVMCLFPIVFFAFALNANFNIGERHILPLYAFALMIAGGIWQHARASKLGKALVVLALCLNAADALRCAPDYLAYFNVFVRPQNSWRLLTDSSLDWGQGLIALRHYEQQHPDVPMHLAYFGSVDPTLYGIQAEPLAGHEQTKGVVVIGATLLSGQTFEDPDAYHWLWPYTPERVIDHCLWVYDVK